jgi:hypothetical protein
METIHEELKAVGLVNTYNIAVRKDGCFQIVPTDGSTRPRQYYKPTEIDCDYRRLVKKYGSDNVKIFREIEVMLQED